MNRRKFLKFLGIAPFGAKALLDQAKDDEEEILPSPENDLTSWHDEPEKPQIIQTSGVGSGSSFTLYYNLPFASASLVWYPDLDNING